LAIDTAHKIKNDLCANGWPEPGIFESGNGSYLIYKIQLENTSENIQLLKQCLEAIGFYYSTEKIDIDEKVFNPARIAKVIGTHARKGDPIGQRPHRISRIIHLPEDPQLVPIELLKDLATMLPVEEGKKTPVSQSGNNNGNGTGIDVEKYLNHYGISVGGIKKVGSSTFYLLDECVFDSDHSPNKSAIGQHATGELFYTCFHNSCKSRTWSEAREKISGDDKLTDFMKSPILNTNEETDLSENVKFKNKTSTAVELCQKEFKEMLWAIKGIIPEGLTLLCGKPKLGKSWFSLNLALAVVSGGKAFDYVDVERGSVLYLALEDSERRLKNRLKKILGNNPPPENFHYAINWGKIDKGGVENLEDWIGKHPDTRVVVIDTLAQIRPEKSGKDLYLADYNTISKIKKVADRFQVAVIVIHHLRKSVADDPFDQVSGTLGQTGAADTVMILQRSRGSTDAELKITGRDVEEAEYAMNL